MKTEFLIIGQGISGTFLSWYLKMAGRDFIIIDNYNPASSSRVAAGIINPVTGRRIVQTWMIDELLPFAFAAYKQLGDSLDIETIYPKDIISFFPSPQMLIEFRNRTEENATYISMPESQNEFIDVFNYDFGYGKISPAYAVNLAGILPAWREKIKSQIIEEIFDIQQLSIETNGISYKDISAQKIIFCDGISSFNNPWFKNLPFAENKGQALIIRASDIPKDYIYKKNMTIVPVKDDFFWVGSSYEWDFDDPYPSEDFRNKTVSQLQYWIKSSFTVEDHLSSLRPATLERRPFVGLHPQFPQLGILNGMGTKGCSLAPYFASQLTKKLVNNQPILPEADISRFRKIMMR